MKIVYNLKKLVLSSIVIVWSIVCLNERGMTQINPKKDKEIISSKIEFFISYEESEKPINLHVGDTFDAIITLNDVNVMGLFTVVKIDTTNAKVAMNAFLYDGGKIYDTKRNNLYAKFLHFDLFTEKFAIRSINKERISIRTFKTID